MLLFAAAWASFPERITLDDPLPWPVGVSPRCLRLPATGPGGVHGLQTPQDTLWTRFCGGVCGGAPGDLSLRQQLYLPEGGTWTIRVSDACRAGREPEVHVVDVVRPDSAPWPAPLEEEDALATRILSGDLPTFARLARIPTHRATEHLLDLLDHP
ncbi:MAG: hypothetical protein KC656_32770, partial [Myxococcales bacterium]|nr:hypothetical protein [Myxococcales bacterium]